jgi:hypothetical protein
VRIGGPALATMIRDVLHADGRGSCARQDARLESSLTVASVTR